MLRRRLFFPVILCSVFALGTLPACGGANQEQAEFPAGSEEPLPPPPQTMPTLPKGHVWRVDVMKVMSPGMPTFLQRIEVKEELVQGKFHGWRIVAFQGEPAFWRGVDLQVGDVITSVNGGEIGHYDQAFAVWSQLATAPELYVTYERAGKPGELRYVIHDDDEIPAVKAAPPKAR